jgi:hypothetical protein
MTRYGTRELTPQTSAADFNGLSSRTPELIARHAVTGINITLTGSVVGPDDYLVLVAPESMQASTFAEIAAQIPEQLRGRVLIVDNIDAHVMRAAS